MLGFGGLSRLLKTSAPPPKKIELRPWVLRWEIKNVHRFFRFWTTTAVLAIVRGSYLRGVDDGIRRQRWPLPGQHGKWPANHAHHAVCDAQVQQQQVAGHLLANGQSEEHVQIGGCADQRNKSHVDGHQRRNGRRKVLVWKRKRNGSVYFTFRAWRIMYWFWHDVCFFVSFLFPRPNEKPRQTSSQNCSDLYTRIRFPVALDDKTVQFFFEI